MSLRIEISSRLFGSLNEHLIVDSRELRAVDHDVYTSMR